MTFRTGCWPSAGFLRRLVCGAKVGQTFQSLDEPAQSWLRLALDVSSTAEEGGSRTGQYRDEEAEMSGAISTLERAEEAVAVLPPEAWPDVSHIVTEDEG